MTEKERYKFKKENVNDFDEYGLESPILLEEDVLTFGEVIDKLNEQEETIQEYKHLVKIATSIIEWNTIPRIRREWQKHLKKVGDAE